MFTQTWPSKFYMLFLSTEFLKFQLFRIDFIFYCICDINIPAILYKSISNSLREELNFSATMIQSQKFMVMKVLYIYQVQEFPSNEKNCNVSQKTLLQEPKNVNQRRIRGSKPSPCVFIGPVLFFKRLSHPLIHATT